MERRGYEDFVSLGARTRPPQPGQDSRDNPDQDPIRTAVEELKRRIKELEEAKKREEANLKRLKGEIERLRKITGLGEGVLQQEVLRELGSRLLRLEREAEQIETQILMIDSLIHILLAIDLWLRREVLTSKGKLAVLRKVLKQLGPLPTLVRIIMAVLNMAGLPTAPFMPVARV